ncbi:MAG: hypothetical protein ACPICC_00960 [Candidatus Puniceispirillaceae bacterium]
MSEAEEILGMVEIYRQRDQAIPVDLLARAEQLGIYIHNIETLKTEHQGDFDDSES